MAHRDEESLHTSLRARALLYEIKSKVAEGESPKLRIAFTRQTDIPTNITNMMGVRIRIRDRQMHEQLKSDLVEHVWRKFGGDENNH
uniref:Uncharacterized protein n=1 Tax=Brassica oleracea var. oleracea TaxID=109376 RepID=A0A0D3DMG6_BRAOL